MTTVRSQLRIGIPGERLLFVGAVSEWAKPGTGLPIIYSTGFTGNPEFAMHNGLHVPHTQIAKYGSFSSIHAGGTATFGNTTAINAIQATVDLMTAEGRPGPYLLYGGSMGYCDLMNWARLNQDRVLGVLCMYGLIDLDEQWTADRDIDGTTGRTAINAAYGGQYRIEVEGLVHNPANFVGDMPFPVQAFIAPDDPLINPQLMIDQQALHDNFTVKVLDKNLGHTAAAMIESAKQPEFTIFFDQMNDKFKALRNPGSQDGQQTNNTFSSTFQGAF